MSGRSYRDLEVWQKARLLAAEIYRITSDFPRTELFGLVQQMRRAAISVASNVAEAHGRRSKAERLHFFDIARGSLLELDTQAIIAGDLRLIPTEGVDTLLERIAEVTRLLNGLIRYYRRLG